MVEADSELGTLFIYNAVKSEGIGHCYQLSVLHITVVSDHTLENIHFLMNVQSCFYRILAGFFILSQVRN